MKRNNHLPGIFAVFLLISVLHIRAQTPLKLSYADFLGNIVAHNPMAQQATNISQYGDLQLRAARGKYDPQLTGSHENKFFGGTNYFTTVNSEIKQPLFTSQFFRFGYDYGIGSYVNPDQRTSSFGLPYVGMEVALLQGMMMDKRRADVLKSRAYVKYYEAENQILINQLLFESSQKYFDWLFSLRQVSLNDYFLELAEQRYRGIEELTNIGERPAVDTIEAGLFIQSRLLDLQNARLENLKNANDLAAFNWQNESMGAVSVSYIPADTLDVYYERAKNRLSQILYQDTLRNPVISKYSALQGVLEIDNRLKKEMIKPQLNVNYNLLSNNSLDAAPVFATNSYKWGINLSFPLLFRTPVNEYRMAKIVSSNNSLELLNKNNELNYKMNLLGQSMSVLAEQLLNAQKSVTYSKRLVEAEKERFALGESSLFLINTRESKWLESELKLAEYKLKFIKAALQIIYLKGNLNYTL